MWSRFMTRLISPIIGSGRPQFLRAQGGPLDRPDEGAPHTALLERGEARDRGAARRGDHVLELARMRPRLQDEPGRAQHRLRGQGHGRGAVESHLDAAIGQRLDHDGDIGGARAREARHRVHGALVQHHHLAHGSEELLGRLEVAGLEAVGARDRRHALQHEGGRIGHDADEARGLAQMLAELPCGHPGRDGDEELVPVHRGGDLLEDRAHDLRLDGEDDDVGPAHEGRVVLDVLDAVLLGDVRQTIGPRVGGGDGLGGDEPGLGQALDERFAHVAGAEEGHALALDAHAPPSVTAARGGRGPKMAVPTRTMVAPSSMATSKSPLMPMEQCSSPTASRSSRRRRNHGRDASAESVAGGMHMRPRTSRFFSPVIASRSRLSSAGWTPPFWDSSPMFTWTSTRRARSAWWARRSSSCASSTRSTDWIQSKRRAASLALFVWSEPMRCHGTARPMDSTFSLASWTRFSPRAWTPASTASRMRSSSTVLDTPTRRTSPDLRFARAQAAATRSCTARRLARMSSMKACQAGRF